jgi:transposase
MRGDERVQAEMFSLVTLEQRVPKDHPLREIRRHTDVVLRSLSGDFDCLYAADGRPSIPPEYVLRALLLQAFYSVRSERQLIEQVNYNLLFRWFVGLSMDDAVWNHAVFSKNRERLLSSEVAQQFFAAVTRQAKRFMSNDHFTVDGTLIQAWASQKSFRKKDGSGSDPKGGGGANFHDEKRSNQTHESTTDPDARLYRKSYGTEAKLGYLGHALVENHRRRLRRARSRPADAHRQAGGAFAAHHRGCRQGLRREGFRGRCADPECHSAHCQERQRPPHQHRRQNHPAPRLQHQPELPVAGREELRMAEADRIDAPGEAARIAQGRRRLRPPVRRPQPDAAAQAPPTTPAGPYAAVRLNQETERKHPPKPPPKPSKKIARRIPIDSKPNSTQITK